MDVSKFSCFFFYILIVLVVFLCIYAQKSQNNKETLKMIFCKYIRYTYIKLYENMHLLFYYTQDQIFNEKVYKLCYITIDYSN